MKTFDSYRFGYFYTPEQIDSISEEANKALADHYFNIFKSQFGIKDNDIRKTIIDRAELMVG